MRNLALMWVLAGVAVALLAAGDGKPSVSTYTDKRDGKVYKIVKIGSQVWFAENLNYAAEGSECFQNIAQNCAEYGRLYDWPTVLKACPTGYHLPTNDEWTMLIDYAGGRETAGTKLKSSAGKPTVGWHSYNGVPDGTDDFGFSALPAGYGLGAISPRIDGYWWSATERDTNNAFYLTISFNEEKVGRHYAYKTNLRSVRCVQDDEKERRK